MMAVPRIMTMAGSGEWLRRIVVQMMAKIESPSEARPICLRRNVVMMGLPFVSHTTASIPDKP
jgi:hypothetical protein